MKITLSQFAGFCNGVRSAFETVDKLDLKTVKKPIYVLGSLVHNQDVVRKIEEKGIHKIDMQTFLDSVPGDIGTVIVTAHGAGPKIYEIAKSKNIEVIDTTCPKVIKVQRLAQAYNKRGYAMILVGDRNHKEVQGIFEWGQEKAMIVSEKENLANIDFENPSKIIILSQTTQNMDFVNEVGDFIRKKYAEVEIADTICLATEERQSEIKKIARDNNAVIVIGSPDSANSTRLFEISREINPKSVFVERADELPEKYFFTDVEKVAVTAGASTPDWIITEVLARLGKL